MNSLFNSDFENSLRLLLLLSCYEEPVSLDRIYVQDFMAAYGSTFGFSQTNANGDNSFMYSEFASRRAAVKNALKQMVLYGHVVPSSTDKGIQYKISSEGKTMAYQLESEYATEYLSAAINLIRETKDISDRELIASVNRKSAESRRRKQING